MATLGGVDEIRAYVDVAGLVDVFADDPTIRRALEPYRGFITGSSVEGDFVRTVRQLQHRHVAAVL